MLEQPDNPPQNKSIDLSTLIAADYAYIAQTVFQVNEERARATTFYILSIASVLATVWTSSPDNVDLSRTALAFAVVFGALSVFGTVTLLQLARLRSAWFESVRAMNHIKKYAIGNQLEDVTDGPFPWTEASLPARFEPKSIAAFLTLQVAIMASIMFGACLFHVGQFMHSGNSWLIPSIIGGSVWGGLSVRAYFWALAKRER